MPVKVMSFGYKFGKPQDATRIIDCRDMANPHGNPRLRQLNGLDADVQHFVRRDKRFDQLIDLGTLDVKDGDVIAFGCVGGQHRSVACAEEAAATLRHRFAISTYHRELDVRK